METVQPIKDKKQIESMKKALHGRNKLLFILGINVGLRISDILKLKVGDVRGQHKYSLREQKTGKAKDIWFNDSVKKAIKELVPAEAADDEYLFKSREGANKPITRHMAYKILNDAAGRAGITEPIGCHTLRKSFGYHNFKAGVDIAYLMKLFNHSSQAITLAYIGITDDTLRDIYMATNL